MNQEDLSGEHILVWCLFKNFS